MPFAAGTMAIGFAALAGALRDSATQKPYAGCELGDAATETTLNDGEFGAIERRRQFLVVILFKIGPQIKSQNPMRICSGVTYPAKQQSNQMFWPCQKIGCGIAGVPRV